MPKADHPFPLLSLPPVLVAKIICFVPPVDVVLNIARVNTFLSRLSKRDEVWKGILWVHYREQFHLLMSSSPDMRKRDLWQMLWEEENSEMIFVGNGVQHFVPDYSADESGTYDQNVALASVRFMVSYANVPAAQATKSLAEQNITPPEAPEETITTATVTATTTSDDLSPVANALWAKTGAQARVKPFNPRAPLRLSGRFGDMGATVPEDQRRGDTDNICMQLAKCLPMTWWSLQIQTLILGDFGVFNSYQCVYDCLAEHRRTVITTATQTVPTNTHSHSPPPFRFTAATPYHHHHMGMAQVQVTHMQADRPTAMLDRMRQLRTLRIRGNDCSIDWVPGGSDLTSLTIEGSCIGPNTIVTLHQGGFPALTRLELWLGTPDYGCRICNDDFRALLMMDEPEVKPGPLPHLRRLGFCNYENVDSLLPFLSDSPLMRRLDVLDLSHCSLGDEEAVHLLHWLESLTRPYVPSGTFPRSRDAIGRYRHETLPLPAPHEAVESDLKELPPRPVGALRGLVLRHCFLSRPMQGMLIDAMLSLQKEQRALKAVKAAVHFWPSSPPPPPFPPVLTRFRPPTVSSQPLSLRARGYGQSWESRYSVCAETSQQPWVIGQATREQRPHRAVTGAVDPDAVYDPQWDITWDSPIPAPPPPTAVRPLPRRSELDAVRCLSQLSTMLPQLKCGCGGRMYSIPQPYALSLPPASRPQRVSSNKRGPFVPPSWIVCSSTPSVVDECPPAELVPLPVCLGSAPEPEEAPTDAAAFDTDKLRHDLRFRRYRPKRKPTYNDDDDDAEAAEAARLCNEMLKRTEESFVLATEGQGGDVAAGRWRWTEGAGGHEGFLPRCPLPPPTSLFV
ncbi:hypothetical protein PAPYR_7918 [Paratrimastix pyriformis]|uniref:F-box domain-containing protein n=1 Tax=Paratrimastix pyriformis TaxID=342808 RepID=A0ABQ8UDC3_9EUKA|nr:hypothetical protein PAPYR_7918 [Paratrimastix pyriformis]